MKVKTLTKKIDLSLSPYQAYKILASNNKNTALLETAEAGSHAHKNSICMVSAALKIEGTDNDFSMVSLNDNGKAFIESFELGPLSEYFDVKKSKKELVFKLKNKGMSIKEDERLSSISGLDLLRKTLKSIKSEDIEDDFSSCLIGAFSFDLVDQFEHLPNCEKTTADLQFYLADQILLQNVDNHSAKLVVKGFGKFAFNAIQLGVLLNGLESALNSAQIVDGNFSQNICDINYEAITNSSDTEFSKKIEQAKSNIAQGDAFQIVLSRNFKQECKKPYQAYGNLRQSNPSPYMYYINFGNDTLFGASPESALKVVNREVSLYPIAGTRKRSNIAGSINYEKEARTEFELITDEKESAEHMMLVDLARNDIARICKPNSRKVTQLKSIVKFSQVMHLVSEVKATLREEYDALDAYKACANMGTLTGAPKIKAAEIIRKLEKSDRGYYGGAVSFMNANGDFDSAIVIRSAVVRDDIATVTAGAGVVSDSEPAKECLETCNKAAAVLHAISQSQSENLNEEVA